MAIFHEETDGSAISTTTKAVVELFILADSERRCLFIVKGAAGLKVFTCLFQRYKAIYQLDDICTGQKFVYEVLGDSACHFYSINMTSRNSDSQLSLISADAYVQIVKS